MHKFYKSLITATAIGITAMTSMLGCSEHSAKHPTQSEAIYQGSHLLRQIGQKQVTTSSWDASYFIFAGGASGQTVTDEQVSFAWLNNNGEYEFMTVPLQKIRIRLNENVITPFVRFRWKERESGRFDEIIYVLVTVNPKDWPVDIHIPTATK